MGEKDLKGTCPELKKVSKELPGACSLLRERGREIV